MVTWDFSTAMHLTLTSLAERLGFTTIGVVSNARVQSHRRLYFEPSIIGSLCPTLVVMPLVAESHHVKASYIIYFSRTPPEISITRTLPVYTLYHLLFGLFARHLPATCLPLHISFGSISCV